VALQRAPPLKQLKEKYQFEPSPQWLEHLQKASVRFNSGGSGSFVSPNGLVITNHHVGADTLQKMGSADHNYLRDGFYAKTQADEIKSTDLELNVLMSHRRRNTARHQRIETRHDERSSFQRAQRGHRCH
jgi:hypothetical protein